MKSLLKFYLYHFEFLYRDSRYRFTSSKTEGANASLTVAGPNLTWLIANERGQIQFCVGPTYLPGNNFWISLIKQYLEGREDINFLPVTDEVEWARDNIDQIERLFSGSNLEDTCSALRTLLRSNAEEQ